MARVTNKEYLARRSFLQKLWENEKTQGAFCYLSPNKQSVLHSYFATSKYDWTDEQALEYRKTRDNGEAFSAGKAFSELCKILSGEKKREAGVRVYPLMRQEIDIKKLCQALWMIAEQDAKKKCEEKLQGSD